MFSNDVTNLLKSVFRIPSLPVLIQRNRGISVIRRTEKLKNTGERRGTHSSSPKKQSTTELTGALCHQDIPYSKIRKRISFGTNYIHFCRS